MDYSPMNEIEGLQFIPINAKKVPLIKEWQKKIAKHDLSNCWGVGIACGVPSGNLEVLDVDCKYDLTGKMWESYKRLLNDVNRPLLERLTIEKTMGGGYHVLYRCPIISGNLKLSNRHSTAEEKQKSYKEAYEKAIGDGKDEESAIEAAERGRDGDKVKVLFETRGLGGYIACAPSPGYEFIRYDLYSIAEITPEERDTLHGIARQFNTYFEEPIVPKKTTTKKGNSGLSAFEDYDDRADVVALLEKHGWTTVKQKGAKTLMLRPGHTTAETSGNYDHDKKWFSVFTTSTEFDPQKAYRPYAVYAVLECNKDFSEASRKLWESGYGERENPKAKEKTQSTRVIQSRIDVEDGDYSFLAEPTDYEEYLQMVVDGTLPQGLTTGIPSLDEYFLFKEGNFVNINGTDNVGKSVVLWYLLLLAAMYHDWKGIIFSSENTEGGFMRKMMQFYWGKPMYGQFAMNESERKIARAFIESHFKIIKSQENLYNYKDIINMVKKTRIKYPDRKFCLIDPYNSLKIDLSGFSKLSTHEYHYEALSEIKSYGQQTKFGWFINHHAVTAAARAKDGEKKYPAPPHKADTEGGSKVPNKSDEFLTIHRITQHPTDWMVNEIHVRKIKDTDTGGRPTPQDMPVKLEMYKGGTAFKERLEMGGYPIDPVEEWHKGNRPKQGGLFPPINKINGTDVNGYMPEKDYPEIPMIEF